MTLHLVFAPLLPWTLLALLATPALLLVVLALVRRARGAWWRVAALAVLAIALVDPRMLREQREARSDVAVIVTDRSASQQVDDRPAVTEQSLTALRQALARMPDLEVREAVVGDSDDGTRLFAGVERALAEVPEGRLAGVLVLTDGQSHDQPSGRLRGPVHMLLVGDPEKPDRRLVVDRAPGYGIVGHTVTLAFHVEDSPRTGPRAPVTLRVDGREVGQRLAAIGVEQRFEFTIEHPGPVVVDLETPPVRDELSVVNNRAALTVNGVRDRLRVLLVSGQPHPGERVWRTLLKSDPSVDLVHFTILRPPDKEDFTPIRELSLIPFPTEDLFEKKLSEFDLLVFDRYVVRHILPPRYFRNVVERVRAGGALLVAVGPEFADAPLSLGSTELADALPALPTGRVLEESFRPTPTQAGLRHPVTDLLAPPAPGSEDRVGHWFRTVDVETRRGTTVLEGAEGRPLLVLDRFGQGRVALLASDHVWLWARGFEGGGPHGEFLRRLAHWLMREPELEEERLAGRLEAGRLVVERRSLVDDPAPPLTVTAPSGTRTPVTPKMVAPGLARAVVEPTEIGLYRIEDGTRVALVAVGSANPLEMAELHPTAERVASAAMASGGGTTWLWEGMPRLRPVPPGAKAHGRDWLGLVRNGASVVTGVAEQPLLPGPVLLVLAFLTLGMAWWREGR